ncbi:MAG: glycosyltransferase involved in cell wall biosynthesis [Zhongshania aliphaticivorans]|jgi:glycosyltransferase involved in cell wall biosynthesis|uniref:Glycosyl transferase n=1 Tax=Zhongshania aliphaticivorans TaxID=1470434 RepID=A0A127M1U8_9GAMM|nr:glycosyltransferase family 4 protein [Zhongshania aliphaticivorans]AMO67213.1 glycosyl transferase [Zhongshania aliphaticivorans]|tara:strand:- start:5357 stop:6478 length:1122 start_codon:yes stop_codon:yes gene_type:complete
MADQSPPLKIVQVLPALNSGGVERGTVELARELVRGGHQSVVISAGGRMVEGLVAEGSEHITMPVHRKSLMSLLQVRPMRRLLAELQADIVHVRSRAPAWIVWLAWRRMNPATRPKLVSTFHGMYSVNFYSAVMARAEHMIAISDCVKKYMRSNYHVPEERITLIPRGLDPAAFNRDACSAQWRAELYAAYPELQGKHIVLMPGRLSRWKGQEAFLDMMARLVSLRQDCHGVVVGDAEPGKQHYFEELLAKRDELGLSDKVTFVGHRSDIPAFYALAAVTCHMSNKEEPFGRTVPESLATGTPVVAFDRGGASESLNAGFPQGLVPADDIVAFAVRVDDLIDADAEIKLPESYYLSSQLASTLGVYRRLIAQR